MCKADLPFIDLFNNVCLIDEPESYPFISNFTMEFDNSNVFTSPYMINNLKVPGLTTLPLSTQPLPENLLPWPSLVFFIFLYIFYKIVIVPYTLLRFYKMQGAHTFFLPLIGQWPFHFNNALKKGDLYYTHKNLIRARPELKASSFNIGNDIVVEIANPKIAKQFLYKQDYYDKSYKMLGFFKDLCPDGLAFSKGNIWKTQRKLVSHALNDDYIKKFLPNLRLTTSNMLNSLLTQDNLNEVDVLSVMQNITSEILGRFFFGDEFSKYNVNGKPFTIEIIDLMNESFALSMKTSNFILGLSFFKMGIFPRYNALSKNIQAFRQKCYEIVIEQKQHYEINKENIINKNFLQQLFDTQNDNEEFLTDWEIVDQFILFCAFGIAPTAHVVTMCLYYLCIFPENKVQIMNEIQEFYENQGGIKLDLVNKMEYTDAFIKEVMRFAAPISRLFYREALYDHHLDEFKIKKGTIVTVELPYIFHNPELYENAEKFQVERWLNPQSKSKDSEAGLFDNFSFGPRSCIGQFFALNEIKIMLCEFIKKTDFQLVEGYRLCMGQKFFYEPLEPVKMNLKLKENGENGENEFSGITNLTVD